MCEPWCWPEEVVRRLTYKRAVSLIRYYDREPKAEEFKNRVEAELAENERQFEAKSLAEKKSAYWDFCRESGCKEADIQAEWEKYLKGGD